MIAQALNDLLARDQRLVEYFATSVFPLETMLLRLHRLTAKFDTTNPNETVHNLLKHYIMKSRVSRRIDALVQMLSADLPRHVHRREVLQAAKETDFPGSHLDIPERKDLIHAGERVTFPAAGDRPLVQVNMRLRTCSLCGARRKPCKHVVIALHLFASGGVRVTSAAATDACDNDWFAPPMPDSVQLPAPVRFALGESTRMQESQRAIRFMYANINNPRLLLLWLPLLQNVIQQSSGLIDTHGPQSGVSAVTIVRDRIMRTQQRRRKTKAERQHIAERAADLRRYRNTLRQSYTKRTMRPKPSGGHLPSFNWPSAASAGSGFGDSTNAQAAAASGDISRVPEVPQPAEPRAVEVRQQRAEPPAAGVSGVEQQRAEPPAAGVSGVEQQRAEPPAADGPIGSQRTAELQAAGNRDNPLTEENLLSETQLALRIQAGNIESRVNFNPAPDLLPRVPAGAARVVLCDFLSSRTAATHVTHPFTTNNLAVVLEAAVFSTILATDRTGQYGSEVRLSNALACTFSSLFYLILFC